MLWDVGSVCAKAFRTAVLLTVLGCSAGQETGAGEGGELLAESSVESIGEPGNRSTEESGIGQVAKSNESGWVLIGENRDQRIYMDKGFITNLDGIVYAWIKIDTAKDYGSDVRIRHSEKMRLGIRCPSKTYNILATIDDSGRKAEFSPYWDDSMESAIAPDSVEAYAMKDICGH